MAKSQKVKWYMPQDEGKKSRCSEEDCSGQKHEAGGKRDRHPTGTFRSGPIRTATGLAYKDEASGDVRDSLDLDIDWIGNRLGLEAAPFVLLLATGDNGAIETAWSPVRMPPEKHRGYAVTWFTLAAALVILFLAYSFRKE